MYAGTRISYACVCVYSCLSVCTCVFIVPKKQMFLIRLFQGKAGKFGDYNCNVPQRTVENILKEVRAMNPDFVFFTGRNCSLTNFISNCISLTYLRNMLVLEKD